MAVYEALLLNTAVPQIQAAQAGDSYVMVVNATTPALRITQTGTGDSILVEDSSNPDSSPFVVTATGSVGIGLSSPEGKLHVANTGTAGTTADNLAVYFTSTNRNANLYIRAKNTEGSVLNFADGDSDVVGRIAYEHSDNSMRFDVSGGEKMRLDTSGNLGLGVTPSAWNSSYKAQQVNARAVFAGDSTQTVLANNWFTNSSGTNIYIASAAATAFSQDAGVFKWFNAPSGTAGNAITFTQAMTLDASGRLLVGTTSAFLSTFKSVVEGATSGSANFALGLFKSGTPQILNGDVLGNIYFYGADNDVTAGNNNLGAQISCVATTDWTTDGTTSNAALVFYTHGTASGAPPERARITSGGDLLVGTNDATQGSGNGNKLVSGGGVWVVNAATADGFSYYNSSAAAYRFYVSSAGTISATNTTISAISDQRLKENIQDLDVGLDKIMALKPRKFDWKEGKGKDIKGDRGWIAQEFEQVFPDMIDEWKDPAPEGEEPYKSVRADLIPVLVKAIQELKAEVDSLKAQLEAK